MATDLVPYKPLGARLLDEGLQRVPRPETESAGAPLNRLRQMASQFERQEREDVAQSRAMETTQARAAGMPRLREQFARQARVEQRTTEPLYKPPGVQGWLEQTYGPGAARRVPVERVAELNAVLPALLQESRRRTETAIAQGDVLAARDPQRHALTELAEQLLNFGVEVPPGRIAQRGSPELAEMLYNTPFDWAGGQLARPVRAALGTVLPKEIGGVPVEKPAQTLGEFGARVVPYAAGSVATGGAADIAFALQGGLQAADAIEAAQRGEISWKVAAAIAAMNAGPDVTVGAARMLAPALRKAPRAVEAIEGRTGQRIIAGERGALVLPEPERRARVGELQKAITKGEAEFDDAIGAERRAAIMRQLEENRNELARLENQPLPGQVDMFGDVAQEAPAPVRESVEQGGLDLAEAAAADLAPEGQAWRVIHADGRAQQQFRSRADAEAFYRGRITEAEPPELVEASGRVRDVGDVPEPDPNAMVYESAQPPRAEGPPVEPADAAPVRRAAPEPRAEPPAPDATAAPAASDELPRVTVNIDDLEFRPDLFQARDVTEGQPFNPAQVEKLRRLQQRGTVIGPPTVVRNPEAPGKYIVTVGHNRTQLAREGGARQITVKVDPADIRNADDLARVQQRAITSNYKTGTSFSEDARAFTRLQEQGADAVEIRDVTKAKSVGAVEDVLDAARLGEQAVARMSLDKTAQGIGAEIGRGMRAYGITLEDANALFNRMLSPDEGGKITSRTAVRDMIDMIGRELQRGDAVQFEGFAGMGADGGGAVKLLNEYVLKKQQLEAAVRDAKSLQTKLSRVQEDAGATVREKRNALAASTDAKRRQSRLEGELKQLERGVKSELAPARAKATLERRTKKAIGDEQKARAEGAGDVNLRAMTDEELAAAASGDDRAVAKLRGLRGESQLEGRRTRFDTQELIEARARQDERAADAALKDPDGTLRNDTPARQAFRRQLIDDEIEKPAQLTSKGEEVPIQQGNEAYIVLGPPAAGKSKVVVDPLVRRAGARIIDSDEFKGPLAEFEGLTPTLKGGGDGYGGVVHDQSDRVWEGVLDRAIERGDNLALPLVGKNAARIDELGRRLADAGYRVQLMFVELDPQKAAQRSLARFYEDDARLVDPEYVLGVGNRPAETFATLKSREWVSEYEHWDNDVEFGQPPRLVERAEVRPAGAPAGDAGGAGSAGAAAPGGARGQARPLAAARGGEGGEPGPGPVDAGAAEQRRAPGAGERPDLAPEPHGTTVEAQRVEDPDTWGDGAVRVLEGDAGSVREALQAAAANEGLPPPPDPPVMQGYMGMDGGSNAEGVLASMLDRPPEESFARSLWRKYTGFRQQEAVELRQWYDEMGALARRVKMPRGKEATPEKLAFIKALHGEGSPDAFPQEWRPLFDALQRRKKLHESRLLAADPSFERKLLPEYWPRQFVQEKDRLSNRLRGLVPGRLRPGKTPRFGIRRKYESLTQALDNGEELVTYDPIDQWARREVEGVEYIYTNLVVQAYKRDGRALPSSAAPAEWLTPPYKAFEPRPYSTRAEALISEKGAEAGETFSSIEEARDVLDASIADATDMYGEPREWPRGVRQEIAELRRQVRTGIVKQGSVRYTQPLRVSPEDYRVLLEQFGLPLRELEISDVLANVAGVSKRLKVTGGLFQHVDLSLRTLARATEQAVEGLARRDPEQVRGAFKLGGAVPRAIWRTVYPGERVVARARSAESPLRQLLRQEGLQETGGIDVMRRTVADAIGKPSDWGLGELPANVPGAAVVNRASGALRFINESLYDALHPELMGAMAENIYVEVRRLHPELTARQAAARAAQATNIVMSAIPEWQSVLTPRIRQFGRGVFFSPNETEAWFRQVSGAVAGPNAETFRRQWLGYAIMIPVFAEAINLAFTGKLMDVTQYSPVEVNGEEGLLGLGMGGPSVAFNPRFMRPRITGNGPAGKLGLFHGSGGRDLFLDLLGQADTPFRWLLAPKFATQSRLSAPVNILWGLAASKHQFTDEPVRSLAERGRFIGEEFGVPISVTGFTAERGRIGPAAAGLQSAGFNVSAERNADLRNRTAQDETGKPYDRLSDQEKIDYKQRHPDHFAASEDLPEESAVRRSVELSEERQERITALGQETLRSGRYDTYAARRGEILQDIASRRAELPESDFSAATLEDKAQRIYYDAIAAAREASPTGLLEDFGQVDDDARQLVREKLGDVGEAALDTALLAAADPIEREYLKARQTIAQSGYWDIGRELWQELQGDGDAPEEYSSLAAFKAGETQALLEEIQVEEPDVDYVTAKAAAERVFKRQFGELETAYNRITRRLRERIRGGDAAVAEALVKWFGLSARGVEDLRNED